VLAVNVMANFHIGSELPDLEKLVEVSLLQTATWDQSVLIDGREVGRVGWPLTRPGRVLRNRSNLFVVTNDRIIIVRFRYTTAFRTSLTS